MRGKTIGTLLVSGMAAAVVVAGALSLQQPQHAAVPPGSLDVIPEAGAAGAVPLAMAAPLPEALPEQVPDAQPAPARPALKSSPASDIALAGGATAPATGLAGVLSSRGGLSLGGDTAVTPDLSERKGHAVLFIAAAASIPFIIALTRGGQGANPFVGGNLPTGGTNGGMPPILPSDPNGPPSNPPSNPPGNPPTNPPGNPPTNPPGNPPTNPPTDPPGNPPTNPPGTPPGLPVNPPTNPPGNPPTNPPGNLPTNPPGNPPSNPPGYPPGGPGGPPGGPLPTPPPPTSVTPEPVTTTLFGTGLVVMGIVKRRRRRSTPRD